LIIGSFVTRFVVPKVELIEYALVKLAELLPSAPFAL